MGKSILQDWVTELDIRYQGTLLAAMRGCDGFPKEDATKTVARAIRNKCLNPADARELAYKNGFMSYTDGELTEAINKLRKSFDQYPCHFILHMMHALEVIGYRHPSSETRFEFCNAYYVMVKAMHLNVETYGQLHERMVEDRIKTGNI